MHFEDQVLLNEIRLRNLKVYEALFSYYYPQLLRFAESYVFDKQECEDITQNILIYFWENAEKINIDLSLRAYFFQSVKNRCLNHLRDLQIRDRYNLFYLETLLNNENPDESCRAENIIEIHEALAKLPKQMAEIFRLKYLEGKKIMEIAKINNVSNNTIKTHLQRAKKKLREFLFNPSLIKFL